MFWALKSAQSRCLGHKWSVKPAAGIASVTAQAFFLEEAAESGAACGEMSSQQILPGRGRKAETTGYRTNEQDDLRTLLVREKHG